MNIHQELRDLEISNTVDGMNVTLSNKVENKVKDNRILDTSWTRIPNCKEFKISLNGLDYDWIAVDIKKKLKPTIKITPHVNNNMNKYMTYQMKRLDNLRLVDPNKYWMIAFLLMKNSVAFRVSAINHVFTNWYKILPFWWILKVNRKATALIETQSHKLRYVRHYIPKPGSDSFRPLGVPDPEWRLVLHMVNNFLYTFIKDQLLESQHGFIPRRGTLTAWKEIVNKVLDADYIYECDLKQFFPSIHVDYISNALLTSGMPEGIVRWIENINSNQPVLPDVRKLDESKHDRVLKEQQDWWDGVLNLDAGYTEWGTFEPDRVLTLNKQSGHLVGVPQGSPTSPLLSILALKAFLTQQVSPKEVFGVINVRRKEDEMSNRSWSVRTDIKSVSYADDPIFYSNRPFEIADQSHWGICINEAKSGWVKVAGEWKKNLKFLGLEYDYKTKNFLANTRKGSRLMMATTFGDILASEVLSRKLDAEIGHKYGTWRHIFESRIVGFLIARLYQGSWKSDEIEQDFRLHFSNNSWLSSVWSKSVKDKNIWGNFDKVTAFFKRYNVFNSSSYASESLYQTLQYQKRSGLLIRYVKSKSKFEFKLFKNSAAGRPKGSPNLKGRTKLRFGPPNRVGRPRKV